MSETETLTGILREMERLADLGAMERDEESDHSAADALLCDAILALAPEQGAAIVAAFDRIKKWYA